MSRHDNGSKKRWLIPLPTLATLIASIGALLQGIAKLIEVLTKR